MPLNKVYLLRHIQHQDNQQIENVYFFNHIAGDGVATNLALDFEGEWLPKITPMQVPSVITDAIACYNLGDLSDFVTLPLATPGSYALPNPLPSFNAVGFSLKLNTRAIRPGSKRIAGVSEGATAGQTIVTADMLAAMETFRLALAANLVGADDTWQHVVVKRVRTAVPGTTPVKYRYNLPVSDAQLVLGTVVAALTSPIVTSQVSRKE